jgi:CDP-diacylglycerol--glycerol-3-phosphate 3-phosphatidyltransferase
VEKLDDPERPTFRERYTRGAREAIAPIVRLMARAGISPNALTLLGFGGAAAAATLILTRNWLIAGFVFAAANVLDSFDGSLARLTGKESALGAFLDSTFDRLGEALVLGALGVTLAQDGQDWAVAFAFLALAGSFLVSYTRARAEGLGVGSPRGGLMSRPERLVLTAAAVFFAPIDGVTESVIVLLAVLSLVTVGQRLIHVHSALTKRGA